MSRGAWSAVAVTGAVGAVGLGAWTWFLAGRSLDVMDQWSSVVSSFATLLSLVIAVLGLVIALRGSSESPVEGSGSRSVRMRNGKNATFTLGDNSPIRRERP